MSTLAIIQDGGMLIRDGKIDLVGASTEIENKAGDSEVIDARGESRSPGFVDAHTHLVFSGNRLDDSSAARVAKRTNKSRKLARDWSTVEKTARHGCRPLAQQRNMQSGFLPLVGRPRLKPVWLRTTLVMS